MVPSGGELLFLQQNPGSLGHHRGICDVSLCGSAARCEGWRARDALLGSPPLVLLLAPISMVTFWFSHDKGERGHRIGSQGTRRVVLLSIHREDRPPAHRDCQESQKQEPFEVLEERTGAGEGAAGQLCTPGACSGVWAVLGRVDSTPCPAGARLRPGRLGGTPS